jgi:plasmid stabilization system protein ParE
VKLIVRPAAAADIEDAHRWYRDKSPELGTKFLDAVREAGARIMENPEAYPVFHREARRVRLKRFPYSLLYRLYPEHVVIVACLHGRRDPLRWKARADG